VGVTTRGFWGGAPIRRRQTEFGGGYFDAEEIFTVFPKYYFLSILWSRFLLLLLRWADLVIRYLEQFFWASPQCHHREPPNQVSHLEGGTGDRKLECDRPFAPLHRHLQYADGTKPHLCIDERNSPTPVRRRFSLSQEGLDRIIPGGERPGDGINFCLKLVFKWLQKVCWFAPKACTSGHVPHLLCQWHS